MKTIKNTSMTQVETIPLPKSLDDLALQPIWVAWRNEQGKKLPLDPNSRGPAKADDPRTWGNRDAAERLATARNGGLGVQLTNLASRPDLRLCGVDLDGCLDTFGNVSPWASAVVERFDSYTEVSPSGTGLHILFFASQADFSDLQSARKVTPKGGKEFSLGNHTEIALFLGGRYFTVTREAFDPTGLLGAAPLRQVAVTDLDWLLTDHGPAFMAQKGQSD